MANSFLCGAGPHQLLAVKPNRLGVRDGIMKGQPDKPHQRQPVLQRIFGLASDSVYRVCNTGTLNISIES